MKISLVEIIDGFIQKKRNKNVQAPWNGVFSLRHIKGRGEIKRLKCWRGQGLM